MIEKVLALFCCIPESTLMYGLTDQMYLRLVFFAAYGEKVQSSDISTIYEFVADAMFGLRNCS